MEETVQRKYLKTIGAIVVISIAYAVLRYNLVGPVAWKDLPIFVLNKGVSLAAIILLAFSFSIGPLANLGITAFGFGSESQKILGISGLLLTIFHILLSVLIFNPQYYPKFFISDDSLSAIGNFSLCAGTASFMILGLYHWCFKNRSENKEVLIGIITSKKFLLGLLLTLGIHLFFMGYASWCTPSEWQGGLPPISLISFTVVLCGFVFNIIGRTSNKKG